MYRFIYRLENVKERLNKVYVGPFNSYCFPSGVINSTPHNALYGFPGIHEDEALDSFVTTCQELDKMVCGVETREQIDFWFDKRHKFKGQYRVVKYVVPVDCIVVGTNQVLFDSRKARQLHVLE